MPLSLLLTSHSCPSSSAVMWILAGSSLRYWMAFPIRFWKTLTIWLSFGQHGRQAAGGHGCAACVDGQLQILGSLRHRVPQFHAPGGLPHADTAEGKQIVEEGGHAGRAIDDEFRDLLGAPIDLRFPDQDARERGDGSERLP